MPLATRRNGAIAAAAVVCVGLVVGLGVGLGTRKHPAGSAQAIPAGLPATGAQTVSSGPHAGTKPLAAAAPGIGFLESSPAAAPAPDTPMAAATAAVTGFAPIMQAPAFAPAGNVLVRPGSEEDAANAGTGGDAAGAPGPAMMASGGAAPAPKIPTPEEALRSAQAAGADPRRAEDAATQAALAASDRPSGRPIAAAPTMAASAPTTAASAPGPSGFMAPPPTPGWAAAAIDRLRHAPGPTINLNNPALYGNPDAPNAQSFRGQPINCVAQGTSTFLNGGPCSILSDYYRPLAMQLSMGNRDVLRSLALAAPTPSDECCNELREFVVNGCSCDPGVVGGAPVSGFSPRQIAIGAGLMQMSSCAAPALGGPIFNPCTMTVGSMYLDESATTATASAPISEPIAAGPQAGGRRLLSA